MTETEKLLKKIAELERRNKILQSMIDEPETVDSTAEPYDAHVREAHKIIRAAGFTMAALQYPRHEEALLALKRYNGLKEDSKVPPGWHYFANAWCRDNWDIKYPEVYKGFRSDPKPLMGIMRLYKR